MWLEDEQTALALTDGEIAIATQRYQRSRELATAYGNHRMARLQLDLRAATIGVAQGEGIGQTLGRLRKARRAA
jgi:hypothetical protein